MKIAIYVSSLKGGGAERVMLYLAQGMLDQKHSVDLLLARYEGNYIKQAPKSANIIPLKKSTRLHGFLIALWYSPFRTKLLSQFKLPRFLSLLPAVKNYINQQNPDIIISALHNCNLSAALAKSCTKSNLSLIVTEHISLSSFIQSVPERQTKLLAYIRLLYPYANRIVAVSDGVKNDLSDTADIPLNKITTIYNPVVTASMQLKMNEKVDHAWLNNPEHFTLLAAGRLTKQKDYVTLINAIELLKNKIPLKLIILGEGSERSALSSLITNKGLADTIELHGFCENPFAFMAHADLFVLSSALEGLSMVLLEALACGCKVVSTDCPHGPSEVLQQGKYGTLVPIKNPEQLAAAIEDIFYGKKQHANGKDYAFKFTLEKATQEYLNLISESPSI
jgi:glycosyltransferase involved in cell wall biosynthesis